MAEMKEQKIDLRNHSKMRKPPFEPVTITLATADEVKALAGLIGPSSREDHARDLKLHLDSPRVSAVNEAIYDIYEFLCEKVNGHPD
jgi:hypothetical protein